MSQADPVTGRYPAKFLADLARVKRNEAEGAMPSELVEALDRELDEAGIPRDDFGDHSLSTIGIANAAGPILSALAAHASPEAKREVLRQLLGEANETEGVIVQHPAQHGGPLWVIRFPKPELNAEGVCVIGPPFVVPYDTLAPEAP